MPQYNGVWTIEAAAQAQSNQQWVTDPNFRNTTLLLQADNAANSAQNNTFLDSSSNSFAITRAGNTTQGTFTPFSQSAGRWSTYYTGVADNNATYLATNAAYSFGTGDFTVEAWVNIPPIANTNGKVIVDSRPDSTNGAYWIFSLTNNGRLSGTTMATGGVTISSTNPIPTNEWVHVAYTRRSGTLNLWVNGLSVATASGNTDNISSSTLWIGRLAFSSVAADSWFTGYMSNLRIVKGVAVYTGNFTPQTAPLTATQPSGVNIAAITGSQTSLLMQQSNRFVDNSSIAAPILTLNTWPSIQTFSPFAPQFQWTEPVIGGSGYFDGTGDYLSMATGQTPLLLSNSDFSFECWVYWTATAGRAVLFSGQADAATAAGSSYFFAVGTSGTSDTWVSTTNYGITVVNPPLNSWAHVAYARTGGTYSNYLNGVRINTRSDLSTLSINNGSTTYGPAIGVHGTSSLPLTGYISGLRLIKGSGGYNATSSTITIPTAPLTAITNTSLLTNFTNAGIYDGTMKNNLETVGNAQVSTSIVKYGSGSMAFDGTGDYLFMPSTATTRFGSANWTIEFWFRTAAATTRQIMLGWNSVVASYAACNVNFLANGKIGLQISESGSTWKFDDTTTGLGPVLSVNTWYHLAVTRVGQIVTVYINGTSIGTYSLTAPTTSLMTNDTRNVVGISPDLTNQPFNGYIDDLRVTNGVSRYYQNFIPPQVALPRQ